MQELTTDQAIDILSQIAAAHVGNLQDHNLAQQALKTLREALKPEEQSDGS